MYWFTVCLVRYQSHDFGRGTACRFSTILGRVISKPATLESAKLDGRERVLRRYHFASVNAHMCDEQLVWNQEKLGLALASDLGMVQSHTAHHEQHRAC